jgi:1,3-propanediol dehydrogenase/alcohol dehydrogenase
LNKALLLLGGNVVQSAAFLSVPKIIYGIDAIDSIGTHLSSYGEKPLIMIGSGSARINGTFDRLLAAIAGEHAIFSNIPSDPDVQTVNAGLDAFVQNECDYLIAVGGGSVLDAAKAVALLAANGGVIADYEFTPPKHMCPPLIAIPTTAGTGSEVTKWSIITDSVRKKKMAIGHEYLMPVMAVLDPGITLSMPQCVTAATGMDALTHAIEAYISDKANLITDMWSLKAIALLTKNILSATYNPTNLEARSGMLYGQLFAGIAFNNSSVALVHAMSRPLGAYYGIPHGEANAMLLPAVMEYNRSISAIRYRGIADAIGLEITGSSLDDTAKAVVAYISELFASLPLKSRLSEFGVLEEDIVKMARDAHENASAKLNPRKPLQDEVISIYRSIY